MVRRRRAASENAGRSGGFTVTLRAIPGADVAGAAESGRRRGRKP